MISGAHLILFAQDAEATRAFLRDVLEVRRSFCRDTAVRPPSATRQRSGGEQLLLRPSMS